MLKYSDDQKHIFNFVENEKGNAVIRAVAGSGKTTTIIKSLDFIDQKQDIIFLAFNKSVVETLTDKVPKNVDVSTFHSYGFKSLIRTYGKTPVLEKKVVNIIYENLKRFGVNKKNEKSFVYNINKLVDFLRLSNYQGEDDILYDLLDKHEIVLLNNEIEQAIEILRISNNKKEVDFVDMLYQPIKREIKLKSYDFVFIDEAQDLSPIQQKLFSKMLKPKGRFIAVGDASQAIYGFAGADVESFDKLSNMNNTKILPLSVCYRCGTSIVKYAQNIVPEIQPYEGSERGIVRDGKSNELRASDWVLCRNTKPLVKLWLDLFRKNKKSYIKGVDIGSEILELIVKTNNDNKKVVEIRLASLLQKQYDKLISLGVEEPEKSRSYRTLKEKIDIIIDFILPEVNTVNEAVKLLKDMFSDKKDNSKNIVLSTIHKAKGSEADRVFVLKKDLMPSKFAKQDWELQQELNLEYVCYTRAKKELIFITDIK